MLERFLEAFPIPSVAHWLLLVVSSFVLEDPTTLYTAALVAERRVTSPYGFTALVVGLSLGDLGLYALGRWARRRRGATPPEHLGPAARLFAIFVARFVPGLRVAVYGYAGYRAVPVAAFFAVNAVSGAIWSAMLLAGGGAMYRQWGWPGLAVTLLALVTVAAMRRRRATDRKTPPASATPETPERARSR